MKLIDSIKNSVSDNNMDMYNLSLNGYTVKFPSFCSSEAA